MLVVNHSFRMNHTYWHVIILQRNLNRNGQGEKESYNDLFIQRCFISFTLCMFVINFCQHVFQFFCKPSVFIILVSIMRASHNSNLEPPNLVQQSFSSEVLGKHSNINKM